LFLFYFNYDSPYFLHHFIIKILYPCFIGGTVQIYLYLLACVMALSACVYA